MDNNKSSNFNQALWLGIGSLCTFLIAFLTAPILVRYFDKNEYGTYRQILYVYSSLQALFTMGLPSVFAYFIPRLNTGQQKLLINRLTLMFLGLGAIFSLALFFGADLIAGLLKNPELSTGIKLFSPFPLFTLPTMGVEGIYTAIRRTKEVAINHIFSKTLMFFCIVLPVMVWHTGYREAIIGWGFASFVTFLVAMYMKNSPYKNVDNKTIPNLYKEVFSYSLPLTGAFIAGFFCNSADQFFVSRYYGTQAFAEFSSGCFSIPIVGMVAASVKNVLLPLFSKADAERNMSSAVLSYNNAVKKTATIIMPMLFFCLFFAGDVMVVLFGGQYSVSQGYLRLYIIRDFLQIFPYFSVLMALGYSRLYMNMHVVGALAIWTVDFLLVRFFVPPPSIVFVSSLFHLSCSITAFIFIFKKTHISLVPGQVLRYVGKLTLHCCTVLGMLLILRHTLMSQMNVFLFIVISGCFFYLLLIATQKVFGLKYLESVVLLINSRRNGKK